VETPGRVLLHDEEPRGLRRIAARLPEGLGGALGVALLAISLEPVGHAYLRCL
jgi:hypothetical protein